MKTKDIIFVAGYAMALIGAIAISVALGIAASYLPK